ncbi:MAG: type I 3-dehydroquinate dehydratase [Planctomycetaceae bacterium]
MICITVTPISRTLAKVDLLNAASQGDIIELCLDHLAKEPDVKDLISTVDKPVIVSCRRPQDGGHWRGTEEERLLLLRQAIVAGPEYIELDLDIAPQIPKYGDVKRVISFTRLDAPESDIDTIFDEAAQHHADVVKFTWPTPTIDDAWPLLAAVSQKRRLPIVGMGLGRPEITFSLLGHKYGSPWIYAALEHGMEAHEGQATVFELDEVYDLHHIDRKTTFVAIAGMGEAATITTKAINAGFKHLGKNVRCLPIEIGDLNRLEKMFEKLHITGVLVFGDRGREILPMAVHVDKQDFQSQYVNLLINRKDGWHGYNTIWRSGLTLLEAALGKTKSGERPLDGRNVLILGSSGVTQAMAFAVTQRKGLVSICGPNDKASLQIANLMGCRHVPYQSVYDTLADVVVIADADLQCGQKHGCLNPSLLKPSMLVMDVSNPPIEHELLSEARDRGCRILETSEVYIHQLEAQFKVLAGAEYPRAALPDLT